MLYTIVPMEELMDEEDARSFVQARLLGCSVLVEPLGDGRGRIERVLSTDPAHYIDANMQPGRIVSLSH